MRKILGATLVVTAIILMSFAPGEKVKWYKYKSETAKVQIMFPSEFKETVDNTKHAGSYSVTSGDDGISYRMNVTIHETPMVEHKEMAQISLETFTEAVSGTVVSQEAFNYKKSEGVTAVIKMEEKGVTIHYRVILIGQNQYQVIVFYDEEHKEQSQVEKFFKSFKPKA